MSRENRFRLHLKEKKESYFFILPILLFVFIFILLPVIGTLVNSTFQDAQFLENKFIHIKNYQGLFSDRGFLQALRFSVLFIIVSVPLELALGLIFALILNLNIPARGLFRACILIPWAIPAAISARTFELVYNYNYGLANFLCLKLHLIAEPINWLGTSVSSFFCIVISDAWKTTPFVAIILLAGLQAIPEDLYSQAKVDRANFFKIFYKVTLPLLKPVIIVALLFRTVDALRIFDLVYVLTSGGPGGSTTSLSLYSYKYFLNGDFGYASSISVVLFIIAFALSIFYIRIGKFESQLN